MRSWSRGWILGLFWFGVLASPAMAFVPRSGSTVVVSQILKDDLYLGGGTVSTTAAVDGDVVAAGGTLDLAGGTTAAVCSGFGALWVILWAGVTARPVVSAT